VVSAAFSPSEPSAEPAAKGRDHAAGAAAAQAGAGQDCSHRHMNVLHDASTPVSVIPNLLRAWQLRVARFLVL
jgi:hypothetical protein